MHAKYYMEIVQDEYEQRDIHDQTLQLKTYCNQHRYMRIHSFTSSPSETKYMYTTCYNNDNLRRIYVELNN